MDQLADQRQQEVTYMPTYYELLLLILLVYFHFPTPQKPVVTRNDIYLFFQKNNYSLSLSLSPFHMTRNKYYQFKHCWAKSREEFLSEFVNSGQFFSSGH